MRKNNKIVEISDKNTRILKEIFSWIKCMVIVLVSVIVLTQGVFANIWVPTGSMESTIMPDDHLIGFRFAYWGDSSPERGDIIIFKYPVDESEIYTKRVIGLPGETVDIIGGKVYINGSKYPLEEDYLNEDRVEDKNDYHFEVPEGKYFVMGDNRNNSLDSRYWEEKALESGVADTKEEAEQYSFVSEDKIMAKAAFIYWGEKPKSLLNTADY